MTVRRVLPLVALLLAGLTACGSSDSTPASGRPTTGSSSPSSSPSLSAAEQRSVDIYVALLRSQLTVEGDVFAKSFLGRTPRGADEPLSAGVQAAISAALHARFDVTWVDSAGSDVPKGIPVDGRYVFLPALPPTADRFRVSVSDSCGNVCGHSLSYVVSRHNDRWKAVQQGAMGVA